MNITSSWFPPKSLYFSTTLFHSIRDCPFAPFFHMTISTMVDNFFFGMYIPDEVAVREEGGICTKTSWASRLRVRFTARNLEQKCRTNGDSADTHERMGKKTNTHFCGYTSYLCACVLCVIFSSPGVDWIFFRPAGEKPVARHGAKYAK